jgi:hypothetical protein
LPGRHTRFHRTLTEFNDLVRVKSEQAAKDGEPPALVTLPGVWPFVRGTPASSRRRKAIRARG